MTQRNLFSLLAFWAGINFPIGCSNIEPTLPPPPPPAEDSHWFCSTIQNPAVQTRAVGAKGKMWPAGTVLSVFFSIDVSPSKIANFKQAATDWSNATNKKITFNYVNASSAKIRVSGNNSGAWSYIGTDINKVTSGSTMNIGWEGYDVVCHELGHTLGLYHEHQNPLNPFVFDTINVVRDLSGPPNNWSQSMIYYNVITPQSVNNVIATNRDDKSIMMYSMPSNWFKNRLAVSGGKVISLGDAAFMGSQYPTVVVPPPPPPGNVTITAAHRDSIIKWTLTASQESGKAYAKTKSVFGQ